MGYMEETGRLDITLEVSRQWQPASHTASGSKIVRGPHLPASHGCVHCGSPPRRVKLPFEHLVIMSACW